MLISKNPSRTTKLKIPAIKIKSENWSKYYKNLFAQCSIKPSSYLFGRNMIKENCSNILDYKNCLKYLKENEIEHFTYCLPSKRKPQMVIRGLVTSEKPEEIKKGLLDRGINVENVTQIFTTRPLPSEVALGITTVTPPRPTPLFIVLLKNIDEIPKLQKINNLFGVNIEINPFQKPREPYNVITALQ